MEFKLLRRSVLITGSTVHNGRHSKLPVTLRLRLNIEHLSSEPHEPSRGHDCLALKVNSILCHAILRTLRDNEGPT